MGGVGRGEVLVDVGRTVVMVLLVGDDGVVVVVVE